MPNRIKIYRSFQKQMDGYLCKKKTSTEIFRVLIKTYECVQNKLKVSF
jgi:hypothetical protein